MGVVFVNYRAKDNPLGAAGIHDVLARRFGGDRVFRDSVSMAAGDSYPQKLRESLERADVLVAVIGPRWNDLTDEWGRLLIQREKDWVRWEIARAIERGIPIVPVLLRDTPHDATPPDRAILPASIRTLADYQAFEVSQKRFGADLDRLADRLVELVPSLAMRHTTADAAADFVVARNHAAHPDRQSPAELANPHEAGVSLRPLDSEALQGLGLRTPPPLPRFHPLDTWCQPYPFESIETGHLLIGRGTHLQAMDVSTWRAEWTIRSPNDDEVAVCSGTRVVYVPVAELPSPATFQRIRCIDPLTGRVLWNQPLPRSQFDDQEHQGKDQPEERVYHAVSRDVIVTTVYGGEVTVWDAETGNVRWSFPIAPSRSNWYSETPLIRAGNVLYVDGQTFVARDLRDGHAAWSGPLWKGDYSSGTLDDQIVFTQNGHLFFVDGHTGKEVRVVDLELEPNTSSFNVRVSSRHVLMDVHDRHGRKFHQECRALTGALRWRTPDTEKQGAHLRILGDALIWSTGTVYPWPPRDNDEEEVANWSFARLDPNTGTVGWGCSFTTPGNASYPAVAAAGGQLLCNIEGDIFRIG